MTASPRETVRPETDELVETAADAVLDPAPPVIPPVPEKGHEGHTHTTDCTGSCVDSPKP
nr:hypothetical protein [Kibdelosporangium sp. MJ126-NF4]CEL21496.1 hypothetical protein [Kibdelosporangium sp. MJ126-NF4]CTQ95937.1 hypothetical protein [Kibdelosporangium sp. MJ126-NF4]